MRLKTTIGIVLTICLTSVLTFSFYTSPIEAEGNGYLEKISSGKIAYDTFSASGGTATDIPWTIDRGNWVVEDGKFRSESSPHAVAFPSGVNVTDVVWEAKVKPMLLKTEGPEILFRAGTIEQNILEAVFDYYHTARLLRVMITPGPYGTPHTTYQVTGFVMIPETWYTMKVIVSGTNLKAYVNDALKFDVTDSNLGTAPPRRVDHEGYYDGEWGYWDDVKIWKSNVITITNLNQGQKVELYDITGSLKMSDTVGTGETQALLDVSALTFPFSGYFKIYATDGATLLHTTSIYQDIWGGDEYTFSPQPSITGVFRTPTVPCYDEEVTVTATITDDKAVDEALLSYTYDETWYNVSMNKVDDTFIATILAQPYGTMVQYMIYANDTDGLWAVSDIYLYIVIDDVPPEIYSVQCTPLLTVQANVSEPVNASGVDRVLLCSRIDSGEWWNTSLTYDATSGLWKTTIFGYNQLAGKTIEYFIEAYDKAGNKRASEVLSHKVGEWRIADLNRDGKVDRTDLFMVIRYLNNYSASLIAFTSLLIVSVVYVKHRKKKQN